MKIWTTEPKKQTNKQKRMGMDNSVVIAGREGWWGRVYGGKMVMEGDVT